MNMITVYLHSYLYWIFLDDKKIICLLNDQPKNTRRDFWTEFHNFNTHSLTKELILTLITFILTVERALDLLNNHCRWLWENVFENLNSCQKQYFNKNLTQKCFWLKVHKTLDKTYFLRISKPYRTQPVQSNSETILKTFLFEQATSTE